jgi:multicomponent Na+:H+ antiporter subunit E
MVILRILELTVYFLFQVLKANVDVAKKVLSPKLRLTPAIVAMPLELRSEWSIWALSQMITLTPGTLTLHADPKARLLYVHVLDTSDPSQALRELKTGFEQRLLKIERGRR